MRLIKTEELGRNPLLVRDVIKLDCISNVNYIRGLFGLTPKTEGVCVNLRGVARIDSILDNELGRLLDGRLEPGSVEAGFCHVWNLGRLWALEADRADPQESILFPRVEFIHEIVGGLGPRASDGSLGVLPSVVRALDTTITNLAGRQGGAPVPADIGLNAGREILVAPNDVILVTKTHASGLLAEGRRTGDCDPTLHTYYTRLFFIASFS